MWVLIYYVTYLTLLCMGAYRSNLGAYRSNFHKKHYWNWINVLYTICTITITMILSIHCSTRYICNQSQHSGDQIDCHKGFIRASPETWRIVIHALFRGIYLTCILYLTDWSFHCDIPNDFSSSRPLTHMNYLCSIT